MNCKFSVSLRFDNKITSVLIFTTLQGKAYILKTYASTDLLYTLDTKFVAYINEIIILKS
jgi:hypothetical protein